MWSKFPQHVVGATESKKPIMFHFDKNNQMDPKDHIDAMKHHEGLRSVAASLAADYKKQGYNGAAEGFRKKAMHHIAQANSHFEASQGLKKGETIAPVTPPTPPKPPMPKYNGPKPVQKPVKTKIITPYTN